MKRLPIFLPFLVIVGIFLLYFLTALTQYPDYDSSYNASVSKNLASGLGYVTSYDSYYFNNYEITTGPTLLIPASLIVKLFGNVYWIGISNLLIIALLSFVLVYIERRFFSISWERSIQKFAILLGLLMIFIPPIYFTQLYGEVIATMLAIIAALIYFSSTKRRNLIAGVVFGLSFITKTIMLILFVPVVLHAAVNILINKEKRIESTKKILSLISSFGITYFVSTIIINLFNPNSFPKKTGASEFFLQNSGLKTLIDSEDKVTLVLKNAYRAMNTLAIEYGNLVVLALIFTVGILFYAIFKKRKDIDKQMYTFRALYVGSGLFAFWWFFFNDYGWVRHVMPAFILLCYLVASFVTVGDLKTRYIWRIKTRFDLRIVFGILFGLLALNLIPKNYEEYFSYAVKVENVEKIEQMYSTKVFIDELKLNNPDSILVGCGDWYTARDLEYIMDSSLNFVKCEPYLSSIPLGKEVYLVRNEHYLYLADQNIKYKNFTENCDKNILYKSGVYVVSKCS